ncbi:MAG: SPASM domain-containing protein, partial [Planctomycetota bacterium]
GRVFVRDFDQALAAWTGVGASLCVYARECGRAAAIEHNGDLYSCDHFVDPEHKLGNIHHTPIGDLANSPGQEQFGRDKWETLPRCCEECNVLFACNGACPKDRFLRSPEGEPGLHYLCEGYKAFFRHVDPHMKLMAGELRAGRPAGGIMRRLRAEKERARAAASGAGGAIRRNAPCPCGSGKKFKQCCMRR